MEETAKTIRELEKRKRVLLATLSPFSPQDGGTVPPELESVDINQFDRFLGGTGFDDGASKACASAHHFIIKTLNQTQQGQKLILQSDVDLLNKLYHDAQDQEHRSAFGTQEGLFPVTINGNIVWFVWTGKFFTEPISKEFLVYLQEITSIPMEILEKSMVDIPVYNDAQTRKIMQDACILRDLLQAALMAEVRNVSLSEQLIESERLRSLGALTTGIAHHFNSLLSIILGYASYVSNREPLSEISEEALRNISEAAQKGRRFTDEILAYSGSHEEKSQNIDIHGTLTYVVSLLQSQISSRIQISTHLNAKSHYVAGPASVVHQVVFNLLSNSIDSMPDGGSLVLETTNQILEEQDIEYISILLKDTRQKPSDEFDALPLSGNVPEGTFDQDTFKLSSIYGMVERLDGTVTLAASSAGESTIQILLPSTSPVSGSKLPSCPARQIIPCTIWIVDDDPIFRKMCTQVLGDSGHTTSEFSSGNEFMDHWNKSINKPDLLILDFSMPECNGLEIREWLNKKNADLSVLLVSGFNCDQPNIAETVSYPKTFFLQKPFSIPELMDIVALALGETLLSQ